MIVVVLSLYISALCGELEYCCIMYIACKDTTFFICWGGGLGFFVLDMGCIVG